MELLLSVLYRTITLSLGGTSISQSPLVKSVSGAGALCFYKVSIFIWIERYIDMDHNILLDMQIYEIRSVFVGGAVSRELVVCQRDLCIAVLTRKSRTNPGTR